MSSLISKKINLNSNIGDRKVSLSFFLEIPFFFSNNEGSFYRFEFSVYNFLKESSLKNYSLEYSMNLKQNFKILKSMFFGPTQETLDKMTKPSVFYTYLFSNSFKAPGFNLFVNSGALLNEKIDLTSDYFLLKNTQDVISRFSNHSVFSLSDSCIQLSLPNNKFLNVLYTAYFNIDTFVSSYSSLSRFYDFDITSSFIFNIKFPRQNLFMLGSQKRATSFFARSVDSANIFSTYFFFLNKWKALVFLNLKSNFLFFKFGKPIMLKLYLTLILYAQSVFDSCVIKGLSLFYKKVVFLSKGLCVSNINAIVSVFFLSNFGKKYFFLNFKKIFLKYIFVFYFFINKVNSSFSLASSSVLSLKNLYGSPAKYLKKMVNVRAFRYIKVFWTKYLFNRHARGFLYKKASYLTGLYTNKILLDDSRYISNEFLSKGFIKIHLTNMKLNRNFNFFLSKFYPVILYFFRQNFLLSSFNSNLLFFNPKNFLYYYFNAIKFFKVSSVHSFWKEGINQIKKLKKFSFFFRKIRKEKKLIKTKLLKAWLIKKKLIKAKSLKKKLKFFKILKISILSKSFYLKTLFSAYLRIVRYFRSLHSLVSFKSLKNILKKFLVNYFVPSSFFFKKLFFFFSYFLKSKKFFRLVAKIFIFSRWKRGKKLGKKFQKITAFKFPKKKKKPMQSLFSKVEKRFYVTNSFKSSFFLVELSDYLLNETNNFWKLFFIKFSDVRFLLKNYSFYNSFIFYYSCIFFHNKNIFYSAYGLNVLFLRDLRFFVLNNILISGKYLKSDHFFFKKKKYFLSYDKFFLKVDALSFVLLRSNLEYFRVFKYNEYLFNNIFLYNNNAKIGLSVTPPNFMWIINYFPIQRKFFFRSYNFYKLFFFDSKKEFSYDKRFMRYILYKPIFFLVFEIFTCFPKFQDFFISIFFPYLSAYIFVFSSIMFCDVDRLNDESKAPFSNLYRPYIYMKELSYFYEPGFMELCFLEYFAPKFFKEFLLTRDIVNFSFFSVLEKFNYKKFSHIDRLSYHIFKLVVFGYADKFFFSNFYHFEGYEYSEAFAFFKLLLSRVSLKLMKINHFYYNFGLFLYNKQSLDLILWDIFNFNALFDWNHLFDDFILYFEKLDIDNSILSRKYQVATVSKFFFSANFLSFYDTLARIRFVFVTYFLKDFVTRLLFVFCQNFLYLDLLLDLKWICFKLLKSSITRNKVILVYVRFLSLNRWDYFN